MAGTVAPGAAVGSYVAAPADERLAGMLELHLHPSLVEGLRRSGALPADDGSARQLLDASDGDRLRQWADHGDAPAGQRACLARSLAELVEVCGGLRLAGPLHRAPAGFWELAGR